jgi:hypothetical protein
MIIKIKIKSTQSITYPHNIPKCKSKNISYVIFKINKKRKKEKKKDTAKNLNPTKPTGRTDRTIIRKHQNKVSCPHLDN